MFTTAYAIDKVNKVLFPRPSNSNGAIGWEAYKVLAVVPNTRDVIVEKHGRAYAVNVEGAVPTEDKQALYLSENSRLILARQ
jgi:hypothetical protein